MYSQEGLGGSDSENLYRKSAPIKFEGRIFVRKIHQEQWQAYKETSPKPVSNEINFEEKCEDLKERIYNFICITGQRISKTSGGLLVHMGYECFCRAKIHPVM